MSKDRPPELKDQRSVAFVPGSQMQPLSKFAILRLFVLSVSTLALGGCLTSVKPIYYDKEQAKAESAVAQFHKLHNEENYQAIYLLLDAEAAAVVNKDEFLAAAKQTFEKWGKVRKASLSEAKVFPSRPIQVRMIYNVEFEKGEAQEWFIWSTQSDSARLIQYQNAPGFD